MSSHNPAEPKYPWDDWLLSGNRISLKKGLHFKCQLHGMAQQIRNAARKRGLKVSLQLASPHIHVEIVGQRQSTSKKKGR